MDEQYVFRLVEIGVGGAAFTLLAWLVRRTFTHTIPRLASDFKESLKSTNEFFKEELRTTRDDFRNELKEQRQDFQDSLKQLREDFKGEIQYLGQRIDRLSDAVRERNKLRE